MSQDFSNAKLVNEHEAAHTLGMKVATLRRWRWSGSGPNFIKIGSAVRYDTAELRAYINANRRSSTSDQGLRSTSNPDGSRAEVGV